MRAGILKSSFVALFLGATSAQAGESPSLKELWLNHAMESCVSFSPQRISGSFGQSVRGAETVRAMLGILQKADGLFSAGPKSFDVCVDRYQKAPVAWNVRGEFPVLSINPYTRFRGEFLGTGGFAFHAAYEILMLQAPDNAALDPRVSVESGLVYQRLRGAAASLYVAEMFRHLVVKHK